MNCRVVVESAIQVYDVETPDEAVQIAISKVGEMLNPDLNYVEIDTRNRVEQDPAYVVADQALVGLVLEMTVFNVEQEEHASRVARKEIGERLSSIPLEVVEIEVIEEEDEEDQSETEDYESEEGSSSESEDETLPEFDEIADQE
jgi:uncharacterized protein (UPF0212 family)